MVCVILIPNSQYSQSTISQHAYIVFDVRFCIVRCRGGQLWKTCGSACTRTCSKPNPTCTKQCVAKCECPSYAPIWCKGKCIKRSKCPGEQSPRIRKYSPWYINNYDHLPTVLVKRVHSHVLNSHEVCTC